MKRLELRLRWMLLITSLAANVGAQVASPVTVEEAIRRALACNRQIKVDRCSIDIARANLLESHGAFDPAVTFGHEHGRERTPFTQGGSLRGQSAERDSQRLTVDGHAPWGLDYSVGTRAIGERAEGSTGDFTAFSGITLTQPLLRAAGFSANLYEVRLARADVRISEWEFRQTLMDTVTRVVVAYGELVLAHEYARVARRSRDLATELLRENEIRVRAGGMAENQLIQARARVAARTERVIVTERALHDADLRLRHLLGEESFSPDGPLLAVQADDLPEYPVDPAADLRQAWFSRPDYQQARLDLAKREATHAHARSLLMPRLDAVGSYGFNGAGDDLAGSRRMTGDRDFPAYSAGLVVILPLAFARERGRLRAARFEQNQAEEELARARQEIALNVSLAAGRLDSARQRIVATREAYALAGRALEDEVKKLRAGTSSTFVVLSLQESLSEVEVAMHRARAETRMAAALYDRETGRTLERHGLRFSPL